MSNYFLLSVSCLVDVIFCRSSLTIPVAELRVAHHPLWLVKPGYPWWAWRQLPGFAGLLWCECCWATWFQVLYCFFSVEPGFQLCNLSCRLRSRWVYLQRCMLFFRKTQAYCYEANSSGHLRFRLLPLTAVCSWPLYRNRFLTRNFNYVRIVRSKYHIDCEVLNKS